MINIDCNNYNENINNIINYSATHKIAFLLSYHDDKQIRSIKDLDKFIFYNGKRNDIFNNFFSEFSMFKYFYNIIQYLPEYICTNHYRRIFDNNENVYLNKLNPNICICYETIHSSEKTAYINTYALKGWAQKKWWNCEWLYNDFKEYLMHTNQYYYKFIDDYIYNKQIFYNRSCFIMHKEKFKSLCEFVLGCFDYIINKYNLYSTYNFENFINSKYKDNYNDGFKLPFGISYQSTNFYRLFAYFGEWLVSIFITANFDEKNIIDISNI